MAQETFSGNFILMSMVFKWDVHQTHRCTFDHMVYIPLINTSNLLNLIKISLGEKERLTETV